MELNMGNVHPAAGAEWNTGGGRVSHRGRLARIEWGAALLRPDTPTPQSNHNDRSPSAQSLSEQASSRIARGPNRLVLRPCR